MATIDHAVAPAPGPTHPRGRRWSGWHDWFGPAPGLRPRPLDGLAAAGLAVVQVAGTLAYSDDEPVRWGFDGLAFALLAVGPVATLFRRRWPEATLAVAFAACAAYVATGYPRGPAGFPAFLFALVNAGMMGRRRFAWGVVLAAYPAFVGLMSIAPDEEEAARSVTGRATALAWLPLVAAAAEIARIRLERRVERAQAERQEARRRASEERLVIARELHDVLAHNISLINVQSGVALHLLDERPEQARPALQAINEASEQALDELGSVLDVLRRSVGGDGAGDDGADGEPGLWAPRAPMAGVRDVDDLVRRTRAAGLDVGLAVEGEARLVPAGVDLAAFRIVQEALTNVVRHAGGDARVAVRLAYGPAELVVQVDDDGGGAGRAAGRCGNESAGAGRGIAGMRERADALGGAFSAGPRPGRGFRVRARFPLPGGAR